MAATRALSENSNVGALVWFGFQGNRHADRTASAVSLEPPRLLKCLLVTSLPPAMPFRSLVGFRPGLPEAAFALPRRRYSACVYRCALTIIHVFPNPSLVIIANGIPIPRLS